jgi:hypothetical protein
MERVRPASLLFNNKQSLKPFCSQKGSFFGVSATGVIVYIDVYNSGGCLNKKIFLKSTPLTSVIFPYIYINY